MPFLFFSFRGNISRHVLSNLQCVRVAPTIFQNSLITVELLVVQIGVTASGATARATRSNGWA